MDKKLPAPAQKLVDLAEANGWFIGWSWDEDSAGDPFVSVELARNDPLFHVKLTWHSRATNGKSLRLFSKIWQTAPASHLDRREGHYWADAPSLKVLAEAIVELPVKEVEPYKEVAARDLEPGAMLWAFTGRHARFTGLEPYTSSSTRDDWKYLTWEDPDDDTISRLLLTWDGTKVKVVA